MNGWSITAAARTVPDRLALIAESGRWTYAALADRVAASARALHSAGVNFTAEGRVMMVAPNTVDTVCALLALFERGVPVMLLHPRSTAKEREALAARYPPSVRLEGPPTVGHVEKGGAGYDYTPTAVPDELDLAVFFTSGTTGRPKAVRLSRRAFASSAGGSAENLGWQANDRWLLNIPLAHVGGLSVLTRCLLARATVVLADGATDAAHLATYAKNERVTLMSMVPTQLQRWLPASPPPTVRAVLLGGAPAAPALRAKARRAGWPILVTYGLTEACSQVTVQCLGATPSADDRDSGSPLPGTEVRIRDGRIWVRGPTLLSGYLAPAGSDDGLGAAFDEEGWFDTSDLGAIDVDGRLTVHARRQDLILSGGENVYPSEVEAALTSLPDVQDAVVFGIEDQEWGQAVAAAVVAGSETSFEFLDQRLRSMLAGPKRPRFGAFLSRLALTPSGKVDRQRVIEAARARLKPI
ncbi:MAG: AMP-binding protein [Myxococcota bacterium]